MTKTTTTKTPSKSRKKESVRTKKKTLNIISKSKIKKRTKRRSKSAAAARRSSAASRTSSKKKQQQQQQNTDRHTIHAIKTEAKVLKEQILQYMDSSGYVSWSAKKRQYAIFGTNTTKDGLVPCPNCGVGQLYVIKSPKSGKRFIGCTNFYGGCDASSPLLQKARLRGTKKACAICKWPEVIFRYSSKQKWTRQCSNITCQSRTQARNDG